MKTNLSIIRKGFTLLELTVAMMVGMILAFMLMAIFNQQLSFFKILRAQSFLNEEAPVISSHISKLLLSAERFRLHPTLTDAIDGTNPSLTDSPVILLNFRQPDGSLRAGILSFENIEEEENAEEKFALLYYVVPLSGQLTEDSKPLWSITDKASNVSFSVESGIIRTRLTGPAGEEIIFSGKM